MALRSGYFHKLNGSPKVLLWGDLAGMHALGGFFRQLLVVPRVTTLDDFCEPVDGKKIAVRMRANRRDTGMRLKTGDLEWTLRPQSLDDFAALVDALATSDKSGHHYLACGVTDEITVMVSRGEYPDILRP
jgi:hypothetical protein